MKKATYIKPEDLENLEYDENGNIIIPRGFEIYIKEDPEELRLKRIAELELDLIRIQKPSNEQLIEEGKMNHPYYAINEELKRLKENL